MPASPFGLAYGLGAGIAGAQQQMQARQMAAQQMAQQALQQQLLQHQVSQQQAEDEAFSQPINTQMDQPTTRQSLQSVMGSQPRMSAPMPGVPGAEGGIPMGPGTVAQGPVPTLQQATAPTDHTYVTPYEKMAYDTAQRAQMLQQKGFGRSAFTLEQQAAQYQQMHHDMALKMAGQAIGSGSYESAIPYLKSVGFDAKNITNDPDNPQNILITRDNGQIGSVPRTSAQLIGADPTKAAEVMSMIQWRQGSLGYKDKMADVAQDRVNQQRERVVAQKQMWHDREETQKIVARIKASTPPAEVKAVAAEARNIAQLNPDLSGPEAESVAWAQRKLMRTQADPKLKAAINATTHISPYTQNPDEQETLKNARTYINDMLKKESEDTGTPKVKRPIKTGTGKIPISLADYLKQ